MDYGKTCEMQPAFKGDFKALVTAIVFLLTIAGIFLAGRWAGLANTQAVIFSIALGAPCALLIYRIIIYPKMTSQPIRRGFLGGDEPEEILPPK